MQCKLERRTVGVVRLSMRGGEQANNSLCKTPHEPKDSGCVGAWGHLDKDSVVRTSSN